MRDPMAPAKLIYAERNPVDLGQHYINHVHAMTAEELHEKSAIAAELAYRDQRIATLESKLGEVAKFIDVERRAQRDGEFDRGAWWACEKIEGLLK